MWQVDAGDVVPNGARGSGREARANPPMTDRHPDLAPSPSGWVRRERRRARRRHRGGIRKDRPAAARWSRLPRPGPRGRRGSISIVEQINAGKAATPTTSTSNLVAWWVEKMATTPTPLREKLTLLLHGQFPTGFDKVGVPIYMHRQNQIFRTKGGGPFDELTLALSMDPSMLIWLDLGSNQRQSPNENFASELMERFTMGIGNYSQRDVREAGTRAHRLDASSYQSRQIPVQRLGARLRREDASSATTATSPAKTSFAS